MMPRISARQKAILLFIHEYAVSHGWAVSLKEIMTNFGLGNGSAHYNLIQLHNRGYIEYAGSRQMKVLFLP
jgi:SOS-response transcriptional repressor LexA